MPSSGFSRPRQDLEQRGLARAVAADQADALRFEQREVRVIEQRDVTERELRVEECDECHVARDYRSGATASRALESGRGAEHRWWRSTVECDSRRSRLLSSVAQKLAYTRGLD